MSIALLERLEHCRRAKQFVCLALCLAFNGFLRIALRFGLRFGNGAFLALRFFNLAALGF